MPPKGEKIIQVDAEKAGSDHNRSASSAKSCGSRYFSNALHHVIGFVLMDASGKKDDGNGANQRLNS